MEEILNLINDFKLEKEKKLKDIHSDNAEKEKEIEVLTKSIDSNENLILKGVEEGSLKVKDKTKLIKEIEDSRNKIKNLKFDIDINKKIITKIKNKKIGLDNKVIEEELKKIEKENIEDIIKSILSLRDELEEFFTKLAERIDEYIDIESFFKKNESFFDENVEHEVSGLIRGDIRLGERLVDDEEVERYEEEVKIIKKLRRVLYNTYVI